MKKAIGYILVALVAANSFWSCEKDDICAEGTPTTPNIIIAFYDIDNPLQANPISNLKYYVEGRTDTITITASSTTIKVPLEVTAPSTKWGFILQTPAPGGNVTLNTDYLTFTYTTQQLYVSRACGYKSLFYLTEDTDTAPNPLLTDAPGENLLWIKDIRVEKTNIEDENEAHINIYY
jgi:hypothetical protein